VDELQKDIALEKAVWLSEQQHKQAAKAAVPLPGTPCPISPAVSPLGAPWLQTLTVIAILIISRVWQLRRLQWRQRLQQSGRSHASVSGMAGLFEMLHGLVLPHMEQLVSNMCFHLTHRHPLGCATS
jgi:hypothetical protein